MKFLICSLISLVFITVAASAQTAPKGANGIELTTNLVDSTLFESVQTYLENEDFTIEKADEELGTIVTNYKVEQGAVTMRILVTIEKNVVFFTGQGRFETGGQTYNDEELMNEGTDKDPVRVGFLALKGVVTRYAQTLDEASLDYTLP